MGLVQQAKAGKYECLARQAGNQAILGHSDAIRDRSSPGKCTPGTYLFHFQSNILTKQLFWYTNTTINEWSIIMKRVIYIGVIALCLAVPVRADMFGFNTTTTTNMQNRELIADQLFMDVNDIAAGFASVLFTNNGPVASTISEIYFGSYLALDLLITAVTSCDSNVDFTIENVKPTDPPGSTMGNWWSITIASAEPLPPPAVNGIDPFECLMMDLSYNSSLSISELLSSGQLQVALHVISIDGISNTGSYSDSFVNDSTSVVPEPASMVLIGVSGSFIAFVRRRIFC